MLTTSHSSSRPAFAMDWLGEALLGWAFLRTGLTRRPSVERLPDHLRRDVGLPPRADGPTDPHDGAARPGRAKGPGRGFRGL